MLAGDGRGYASCRSWSWYRVQGSRLDRCLHDKRARHLKVDDLLDRLLSEEELG